MNALLTLRLPARALVLLALVAGAAHAQVVAAPLPSTPSEGKPDIRYERVAGEVVLGSYAGVLGYFVGRGAGTIATTMMADEHDRLRENLVNGVGIGTAAFAIGGTVYAIGNIGAETGSFRNTMVGVTAGVAMSLLMSKVMFNGRMPVDEQTSHRRWLMAALDASLPAIGGTIAFNASRKWQR